MIILSIQSWLFFKKVRDLIFDFFKDSTNNLVLLFEFSSDTVVEDVK